MKDIQNHNLMVVIVNPRATRAYLISRENRNDYYDAISTIALDLYDPQSGDPINRDVEEMDSYIRSWEPELFVDKWNYLLKNTNWTARIQ